MAAGDSDIWVVGKELAAAENRLPRVPVESALELPPILEGQATPAIRRRVGSFYGGVAEMFERWVSRRDSKHTQRAYRNDVMGFVRWRDIKWPEEAHRMLSDVSVQDIQDYREHLATTRPTYRSEKLSEDAKLRELEEGTFGHAPKTLNRRITSLSAFYKFMAACAAELRLPINVPNPAHAQFVPRKKADPRDETRHLTASQARKVMALPDGDDVFAFRDRAILKLFLYTGIRLGTGCRLNVGDFHVDEDGATLRINEKGGKRRTIGIHFVVADALRHYLEEANIARGPLFRARASARSDKLGSKRINEASMYRLIKGYVDMLPGAVKDGRSVYWPHSFRATTATLLLDAGEPIENVQALLGHADINVTRTYYKRKKSTSESASHNVPI